MGTTNRLTRVVLSLLLTIIGFVAVPNIHAKGIAICIGLNSVDPAQYEQWDGKLNGCENDAHSMADIASSSGFVVQILLTTNATRSAVLKALEDASAQLTKDDILMISYSGHGGQVPDKNGDETDGLDETWCLYDGEFIDDELYNNWAKFKPGVRILMFSDSCHSGSVLQAKDDMEIKQTRAKKFVGGSRAMPPEDVVRVYRAHQEFYDGIQNSIKGEGKIAVVASVQSITACRDNQEAGDGPVNGVFTDALKQVWNNGKFEGDYDKFSLDIRKLALGINSEQEAQQAWVPKADTNFAAQKPFTVAPPQLANKSK